MSENSKGPTILGKSKKIKLLELIDIYKEFPGVIANNNINLSIKSGEIHALLGENGAGKTTLMNILYGIYQPDHGKIYINEEKIEIKSPRNAIENGIGMVHQHFMLIPTHTVTENICLGLKDAKFFNPAINIAKKIIEFCDMFGLKVNPDSRIWQLSAGEQQRVEIIKVLLRGASLLILDEPTSVLTPQETEEFFSILKKLVDNGHSVIFITHKLEEVFNVSNRVTVLRQGKVISTVPIDQTNKIELAKMMVGREIVFNLEKKESTKGKELLDVKNLYVVGDKGNIAVNNLSFKVREGEIFGIAGVAGNGQRELVEAITGLRKIQKGEIKFLDKNITNKNSRDINEMGIAHIPEERLKFGTVPNFPIYENTILKNYYKKPFSNKMMINYYTVKEYSKKLISEFSVSTPSINIPLKLLSGGNIQKLILAREISSNPRLIVAAHATYGLDIAATEFVRKLLLVKRDEGIAILLLSEDLEEIINLSDRMGIMFMGEFMGIVSPKEVDIENIGLMMAGVKKIIGGAIESKN